PRRGQRLRQRGALARRLRDATRGRCCHYARVAMTALDLRAIARALGGEVSGRRVLAPGPQHSPNDRSLCVSLAAATPSGFLVHSFAGDDPIQCKDYVRARLGLPAWPPGHQPNPPGPLSPTYAFLRT